MATPGTPAVFQFVYEAEAQTGMMGMGEIELGMGGDPINEIGTGDAPDPDPNFNGFFDVGEETVITYFEEGMMMMTEEEEVEVRYIGYIPTDDGLIYVFQELGGMMADPDDLILAANFAIPASGMDNDTGFTLADIVAEATPTCFAAGTLIRTPEGERCVETLNVGDLVMTPSGAKPVKFLGRTTSGVNSLRAMGKMPIRIQEGALGDQLPIQDILTTPSHAFLLEDHLVEAAALINGSTIQQLSTLETPLLTLYSIELEEHAVIWANGLMAETYFSSYRDTGFSRESWDNYEEYLELYTTSELMTELSYPRVPFSRQLPVALRDALQISIDLPVELEAVEETVTV